MQKIICFIFIVIMMFMLTSVAFAQEGEYSSEFQQDFINKVGKFQSSYIPSIGIYTGYVFLSTFMRALVGGTFPEGYGLYPIGGALAVYGTISIIAFISNGTEFYSAFEGLKRGYIPFEEGYSRLEKVYKNIKILDIMNGVLNISLIGLSSITIGIVGLITDEPNTWGSTYITMGIPCLLVGIFEIILGSTIKFPEQNDEQSAELTLVSYPIFSENQLSYGFSLFVKW